MLQHVRDFVRVSSSPRAVCQAAWAMRARCGSGAGQVQARCGKGQGRVRARRRQGAGQAERCEVMDTREAGRASRKLE